MKRNYSVFFLDGDEANDNFLTHQEAMQLANDLENEGYEIIIARLVNNEWVTEYESV